MIDWEDEGNRDWSATSARGEDLTYAGARSGLFDLQRNSMRLRSRLTLARRGLGPAVLFREGPFDQVAKWAGYAVEHQTGDAAFDRRVYLGADDAAVARALAAEPSLREAVLDLLAAGAGTVRITGETISATLRQIPSPDHDGGDALTGVAERLCAVADLWPKVAPSGAARVWTRWINRRTLGLAWWALAMLAVTPIWPWSAAEGEARQIEVLARPDVAGLLVFLAVALGPLALLGGRRATSHRILAFTAALTLVALPLSDRLLQFGVNRLHTRQQTLVPATLTALWRDTDGLHRDGYEATVRVDGRDTHWELGRVEGDLAQGGELCLGGVIAEGLRGLRYVKAVRSWRCAPSASTTAPKTP